MLQTIVVSLFAGIGGLFLATKFIPGISFSGSWENFLIAGLALGVVLIVIKPFVQLISLVLRILIIGVATVIALWILQFAVPELQFEGIAPVFYGAAIVIAISLLLSLVSNKKV